MNTRADKTEEKKSNAVANGMAVQQVMALKSFQSGDTRSEIFAQSQLQEAANSSEHVKQIDVIQTLVNNSSQVKQLKQTQETINKSSQTKRAFQLLTNAQIGNISTVNVAQLEDIEMETIRTRNSTCRTIGVTHENGRSFASVYAEATHLQSTDRVSYEIAWDAAVAPIGHPWMVVIPNIASDFVVDRSQTGEAIGDSDGHYRHDGAIGFVFEYRDGIEWPTELNGGSWRFRLRVINGAGTEVARSEVANVNWSH